MTEKDKKWLKENEPWTYDDYFSDPTGVEDTGSGCVGVFFICLIGLGIWGLVELFI
mgnify:CR=1 FL=1